MSQHGLALLEAEYLWTLLNTDSDQGYYYLYLHEACFLKKLFNIELKFNFNGDHKIILGRVRNDV